MFARTFRTLLALELLLLTPAWAWSPGDPMPYTPADYTTVDLDSPLGSRLTLGAVEDDGSLMANDYRAEGKASRIAPDHTLSPIECSVADFPRRPNSGRGGPNCTGMNTRGVASCDDIHLVTGLSYGIVSFPPTPTNPQGSCWAYLVPGSTGTKFTGISDVDSPIAYVLGEYSTACTGLGETGLLCGHSFAISTAGLTSMDGPGLADRNELRAWNTAGRIVGLAKRNIDANNAYTPVAFLREVDGTFVDLIPPTGKLLCSRAINNGGIVVATEGSCESDVSRVAWWIETSVAPFTYTPLPLPTASPGCTVIGLGPRGLSANATMAGVWYETCPTGGLPGPGDTRLVGHGFVAVPTSAARPPDPAKPGPREHGKPHDNGKDKDKGR